MENLDAFTPIGKPTGPLKARLKRRLNKLHEHNLRGSRRTPNLPDSGQGPLKELTSSQLAHPQPGPSQSPDVNQTSVCIGCGSYEFCGGSGTPEPGVRCEPCQLNSPFLDLPAELHLEIVRHLDCVAVLTLK